MSSLGWNPQGTVWGRVGFVFNRRHSRDLGTLGWGSWAQEQADRKVFWGSGLAQHSEEKVGAPGDGVWRVCSR